MGIDVTPFNPSMPWLEPLLDTFLGAASGGEIGTSTDVLVGGAVSTAWATGNGLYKGSLAFLEALLWG